MKTFDLDDIRRHPCPNLWQDLHAAGKLVRGRLEVPDEAAARILAECGKIHGAGDVVALIAQPIARAIDAIAGTKLAECGGCKKRRAAWNEKIPLQADRMQQPHPTLIS